MSREKQIEEVRKDIFAAFGGYAKWEEDWQSLAEAVYNAGYRKQSEGEWIVCGMFDDFFKCSSCGDKHPWQTAIEYKYCPNCGAHMTRGKNE